MAGQLQRHPLTELIREISAGGLSGALRLARERAKTVVYFDAGEIIYAASNLRAFRLAESARRWKVLSEEQLSGVQGKTSDLELGAALVETEILSPETLDSLLERQVTELLCRALLWTDGDWDFDPRARLASNARVSVNTRKLLVESARRLPAEFASARLADKYEKIFPEVHVADDVNLLPTEAFVLTRVDAPLSINELLAVGGLPEAETLHVIYTLALGGFLRRERWPQALSREEIARARAVKATTTAKQDSQTVRAEPKIERKAEAQTEAKVVTPKVVAAEEPRDEQGELEAFFARLSVATDYYQALGIRRSANVAEIKRAYYALAKRFHPDRFRREVDAARLASIEKAFTQVAQAYETLKGTTTRATYDSKLLKQEQEMRANRATATINQTGKTGENQSPANREASPSAARLRQEPAPSQVEEIFQQGLSALQQGNSALAIASLGEAARLRPNESRYRAYFGQALSRDERLRHSAEAELKAAIALDANNASYRVMLAELYSEIGLLKRAQGELERALAAEPNNDAARRLREKLKRG
jgi:curved DNA-binding protein CbpA